MSITQRSVRLSALAAATVLALSSSFAVSAADRVNLATVQPNGGNQQFIVKYRDASRTGEATLQGRLDRAASTSGLLNSAASRGRGKGLGLQRLRRMATGAEVVRADRKLDRTEAETLMRQIAADPNVEYVEVDRLRRPLMTPNDTHYANYLWGMQSGTGGAKFNQAWDSADGEGVVVAVIDTGIVPHVDLDANVLPGYDFISDSFVSRDGNGRDSDPTDEGDWNNATECDALVGEDIDASDSSWHGTHVAGTVAAVGNNNKGVIGGAYKAKLVPVRVLGRCGGFDSDISDAITWASGGSVPGVPANPNPAEVINMSLGGGGGCTISYQNAINGAVGRGSTVVAAAGNDNVNVSRATPANCANVVAVAATTTTGSRASYSNYGAQIDVSAPGGSGSGCSATRIVSTANGGSTTATSAESYRCYNGTSMATPHVSALVALMQSVAPTPLTPALIESTLKSTARALPGACSGGCGAGIIDAKAAVDAVVGSGGNGGGNNDPQTYSNGSDYTINDYATVESPIAVSGRSGNGPASATIAVDIRHTYKGDLKVDLVAPDGSVYNLHNRSGGSTNNVIGSYTRNLSGEALNGTWKLRVADQAGGDTGYINSWSITF